MLINQFRPLAAVVAALVTAGLFVWLDVVLAPPDRATPDSIRASRNSFERALEAHLTWPTGVGRHLERNVP